MYFLNLGSNAWMAGSGYTTEAGSLQSRGGGGVPGGSFWGRANAVAAAREPTAVAAVECRNERRSVLVIREGVRARPSVLAEPLVRAVGCARHISALRHTRPAPPAVVAAGRARADGKSMARY